MPDSYSSLYIGLMSGTSLDSIDCVLVDIQGSKVHLIDASQTALPTDVCTEIQVLNTKTDNELHRCCLLSRQLGFLFADSTNQLLQKNRISPQQVQAIGSHGQTIRHQPNGKFGFTLQIGDASTIAEMTGICVVSDFRSRDIAAGGQGAPLVPLFHQTLFNSPNLSRTIVNIGGMANITPINKDNPKLSVGFDTGPGNILLNSWCKKHTGKDFDDRGNWAKTGTINHALLKRMLLDPYFSIQPPKSTGRELFDYPWLNQFSINNLAPVDVMATLTELTAQSIAMAIEQWVDEVLVCGGGAHNDYLLMRIENACRKPVKPTTALGIDPDYIEANAFAWLAHRRLQRLTGNSPASTGAIGSRVLGAVYYP